MYDFHRRSLLVGNTGVKEATKQALMGPTGENKRASMEGKGRRGNRKEGRGKGKSKSKGIAVGPSNVVGSGDAPTSDALTACDVDDHRYSPHT